MVIKSGFVCAVMRSGKALSLGGALSAGGTLSIGGALSVGGTLSVGGALSVGTSSVWRTGAASVCVALVPGITTAEHPIQTAKDKLNRRIALFPMPSGFRIHTTSSSSKLMHLPRRMCLYGEI
ncbi:MAG: hypothetical protein RRY65_05590 [Pseudoflavonifractor sp.]